MKHLNQPLHQRPPYQQFLYHHNRRQHLLLQPALRLLQLFRFFTLGIVLCTTFSYAALIEENRFEENRSPVQPTLQSTQQAYAIGIILGALVGAGCCALDRNVSSRLWPLSMWPLNIVCIRIAGSLIRHSLVYAYLAFAEAHGITCHRSTMHVSAGVADWLTYLAIKNYH